MEKLQTTSSVDLRVTKDDLIDILIDEQLTILENKRDVIDNEYQKTCQEFDSAVSASRKRLDKKLMKFIPDEVSVDPNKLPRLVYNENYTSTEVTFKFENFDVRIKGINTIYSRTKAEESKIEELRQLKSELYNQLNKVRQEINTLEGNNKRTKAKMLRSFLSSTKEGKEILGIIGKTPEKTILRLEAKV